MRSETVGSVTTILRAFFQPLLVYIYTFFYVYTYYIYTCMYIYIYRHIYIYIYIYILYGVHTDLLEQYCREDD